MFTNCSSSTTSHLIHLNRRNMRCDASEVEDEVVETMIWGEKDVELEREATQDVKDAEAALQRALQSSLFDSQTQKSTQGPMLGENTTVHNVLSDMVDRVSSETSLGELWEAVQKATLALSLAEARLQVLMESARHEASEIEDEVLKTMIWGEKAIELEREATQDVKDAEAAFERELQASLFYSQVHGQVLDGKPTFVDEDEISRGMAEKQLAVDEVYTCEERPDMPIRPMP
ncbi:hypothetical protein ISN44_As11g039340 [Arabidopsis suecica]|uniref:Uncharacterized protein n=1 Tax=Arabidopsis suecica TaxID=45249 RepID=A0A8T1ZIV9_ARASU|nr:hypothetical protein ISN44_As11g039340 [Arabidopsis suecica]